MLADQEVELVEKELGLGWKIKNLMYIHRDCSSRIFYGMGDTGEEHIDLFAVLEPYCEEAPAEESPYAELTEFFRLNKRTVVHLKFQEIEHILGEKLPWEAYCFEAFWYEGALNESSTMWRDEGFPFHTFQFSERKYDITAAWISQGYKIKSLRLESSQVTFRKKDKNFSGFVLPKELTEQPLPEEVAYQLSKLLKQFVKEHGL